jgi:hypothetical protein
MTVIYDKKLLLLFCKENKLSNVRYIPNEVNDKQKTGPTPKSITRETIILGDCKKENCGTFVKSFRKLYEKKSPFCELCTKDNANRKRKDTKTSESYEPKLKASNKKRDETCLKRYGNKNAIASNVVRQKTQEKLLDKHGVTNVSQIKEIQIKKKQKQIDSGDLLYSLSILHKLLSKNNATLVGENEINEIDLTRDTIIYFICECTEEHSKRFICIEKFGAYCEQCQAVHALTKSIATNMKKLGVAFPSQHPDTVLKMKLTFVEHFGTDNPQRLPEIREKTKNTCMERLGVEFPMQSKIVQQTSRINNNKKYGVDHPMQVPEISERCSTNSYLTKDYLTPNGDTRRIQGYENYALDELFSLYNESDVVTGRTNVPVIWYVDKEGIKHIHYVDIMIISEKKFVEVKSTWTFEKDKDYIFLKQEAGKKLGFGYEIWVYNGKGERVGFYN